MRGITRAYCPECGSIDPCAPSVSRPRLGIDGDRALHAVRPLLIMIGGAFLVGIFVVCGASLRDNPGGSLSPIYEKIYGPMPDETEAGTNVRQQLREQRLEEYRERYEYDFH